MPEVMETEVFNPVLFQECAERIRQIVRIIVGHVTLLFNQVDNTVRHCHISV